MNQPHEDVFFYLDLVKDLIKRKYVIQAISYYINEKNKANNKGRYSVLIFQEEGNPIFITNKKDSEIITKVIEENWKSRPKKESYFENGLFYIFSYIAESIRKKSKFNRVIVITDTPSDLNDAYQEALFNLVSKIKHFPTFIDIIRFSDKDTRFFKDDVKLNILASDTKGGIFYVKDKDEFQKIIEKLVKSKQLVTTFAEKPDQIQISQEDYKFYSRLAKKLEPIYSLEKEKMICFFCNEYMCPVCTSEFDIPLKCPDCDAMFHNCCATNYTLNHNIGIPHIWRCPKCDALLQINEDEIIGVATSETEEGLEFSSVKEYIGMENLSEIPIDEAASHASSDDDSSPKLDLEIKLPKILGKKEENFSRGPYILDPIPAAKSEKTIRIGGFFGKVYSVKKLGDKLIYEKIDKPSGAYQAEVTIERPKKMNLSEATSSLTPSAFKDRKKRRIRICPQCGVPISSASANKCSNCGYILKN